MSITSILARIARFAELLAHFCGGLATLAFRFGGYSSAQREATIRQWSLRFLAIVHVEMQHAGTPPQSGMIVMNHISWLDVVVLNAVSPSRFVSKAEVARWPLVGYLCTRSGTLYIERTRKTAARRTNRLIADALEGGERVAVFPEGTTTAGDQLLRFHAALLQPAIACAGIVHPVTVQYFDARAERSPDVSYLGDESFMESVWQLLGAQSVIARLRFDPPELAMGRHRRELADCLHATINRRLVFDSRDTTPGTSGRPLPARH